MHDLFSEFERVTPDLWQANEQEWKEKLHNLPNWYQIPLINTNDLHNLPDGSLVRFRGMVQDMHNPEFYFEDFEVVNTVTSEVRNKSGKYRDTAHILENEKVNYADNLKSAQRQTLVVITIPGLNEWAQQAEHKLNHLPHLHHQPSSSKRDSSATTLKRSYHDTEDSDMEHAGNEPTKELKTKDEENDSVSTVVSREHLLNFPLPDMPSKSCIVKIYDESDSIKLNDMIEVVGFLSVDPSLSGEFMDTDDLLTGSAAESATLHPPPSLVPRLHAVALHKLSHCNPLVTTPVDLECMESIAEQARGHLMKVFTELLLGDELAAEYLICHLVAGVYLRQDTLTLGQCCLNLGAVPPQLELPQRLSEALASIVTHSYMLPLTIDNLNTMDLLPRKDYSCNRLTSGVLQLSAGTTLVLDECRMCAGTLQPRGVSHVAALAALIQDQKVEYDFKYYTMQFDADVRVLVLSEGKSMLPCDYYVPLVPSGQEALTQYAARSSAAAHYLRRDDVLTTLRTYLTYVRTINYTASDDVKFVEEELAEMLGGGAAAEELHGALVLARLVARAAAASALRPAHWRRARELHAQRIARIQPAHTQ